MRLSDAIATGRVLIHPFAGGGLKCTAGPNDGCVLDMALAAVGAKRDWTYADEVWPWLKERCKETGNTLGWAIIDKFDYRVMVEKSMTLDQLIDWVRANEPAEVSPITEEKTIVESAPSLVAQG